MTEAKRLRERLSETEKLRALGELASGRRARLQQPARGDPGPRAAPAPRRGSAPDVDRDLAVIEKAAQDGRETVRRIQEFSRTRRDRQFEPVDLAEILADAVEITRTRWKDDAMRRNVHDPGRSSTRRPSRRSWATPSELREVFTNLILNAVDAMPQGGRLDAARAATTASSVVARGRATPASGMTEEIRQHLFDPFFTTKGARGMGLGMSVVYGIVTRHGGTIDVDDRARDRARRFTLEFPVDARSAHGRRGRRTTARRCRSSSGPGASSSSTTSRTIAAVVKDVLATRGARGRHRALGRDALEMIAASPRYDLVFTDLGMPDMSGWEVAERISARATRAAGRARHRLGHDARRTRSTPRAAIAAVVHKPFEIDELLEIAHAVLQQVAARAAR